MKKAFIIFSLLVGSIAHAECPDMMPLCHAMHQMSSDLECLKGELPAAMCDGTEIQDLAENAKAARSALLAEQKPGTPQATLDQINALFDQLDQAIVDLQAAGSDATLKAAAIGKIDSIREQGHMTFINPKIKK